MRQKRVFYASREDVLKRFDINPLAGQGIMKCFFKDGYKYTFDGNTTTWKRNGQVVDQPAKEQFPELVIKYTCVRHTFQNGSIRVEEVSKFGTGYFWVVTVLNGSEYDGLVPGTSIYESCLHPEELPHVNENAFHAALVNRPYVYVSDDDDSDKEET